jgi:antitoxin CptB
MTTRDTGLTDAEGLAREVAKLRWQCRRGMLELDLLLNRFLDSGFKRLDQQARVDFVRLLGYQDQIIYDWLMGQSVPAEAALRRLVAQIREAMRP